MPILLRSFGFFFVGSRNACSCCKRWLMVLRERRRERESSDFHFKNQCVSKLDMN